MTTAIEPSIPMTERLAYRDKNFDRELRTLIKQALESLAISYKVTLELGVEVPIEIKCLENYLSIYNQSTVADHIVYFETLYNSKREAILHTLQDTTWLTKGVTIQFGGNDRRFSAIKIMLSSIYNRTLELQANAKAAALTQSSDDKDLIRPNIIVLHLLRIFYHLCDTGDKQQLGQIVLSLEKDLGISPNDSMVNKEPWAPKPKQEGTIVSSLFGSIGDLLSRIGLPLPNGCPVPTESDVTRIINVVATHEATVNSISNVVAALSNNTGDTNKMIDAISDNIKDVVGNSTLTETVRAAIGETFPTPATPNPLI